MLQFNFKSYLLGGVMELKVRQPAVAGTFYPKDTKQLRQYISSTLSRAKHASKTSEMPAYGRLRGLVVPHAGYVYSGEIAARGFSRLIPYVDEVERVLVIGPAHRLPVNGIALSGSEAFETPIGKVEIAVEDVHRLSGLSQVSVFDAAHLEEHCIEVELPFLQVLTPDVKLIPAVVGRCAGQEIVNLFSEFLKLSGALIVVSTDLSHFLSDGEARTLDELTDRAVMNLDSNSIEPDQACGAAPLKALIKLAGDGGWTVSRVAQGNSGEAFGDTSRVVGYGAWAFYESAN
jgi:AmmeMemoRadiSam system protein B